MPAEVFVVGASNWVSVLSITPSDPGGGSFIPGETMPIYIPNVDVNAAVKNIGNAPGVTRTAYPGTVTGGITNLQTPGTIENRDFIDTVTDVRASITFKNCRFITTNYTAASYPSLVRSILGNIVATDSIVFEDCEFHNRAQRITTVFQGRNATFRRCVFTGGVDGIGAVRESGSTATNYQPYGTITVEDSWIGDHCWWYHPTPGVIHSNDTQPHIDGIQIQTAGSSPITATNTFFGTWASAFVGTGTPGAGGETNPYSSTYTDIDQATQNSWRASFLNAYTRADQSFEGISRRLSTGGGSWACVMMNYSGLIMDKCWLSGGGVQINAVDSNLNGLSIGSITNSTFWNDMILGHSLTTTAKGTSIYKNSSATLTTSNNKYWDETPVPVANA